MCKYLLSNPKPSSHLSFLFLPFFPPVLSVTSSSSPHFHHLFATIHPSAPSSVSPFVRLCGCGTWQALSKKENKGGESPELESALILTPRTEEKYKQINEEFDHMIKSHKIPVSTGLTLRSILSRLTKCWLSNNANPANHHCLPLD